MQHMTQQVTHHRTEYDPVSFCLTLTAALDTEYVNKSPGVAVS